MLPWPRQKTCARPHLSVLHSIINTSLGSSFFSLSWSASLLRFMGLIVSLPVLDQVLCSRICHHFSMQHKPKLTPQSHLCDDPSFVPLKALDMCFSLQVLCDTQKPPCGICYKNLNTRAQRSTTQGLLLALSREIQSHKSHKQKILVSSHV